MAETSTFPQTLGIQNQRQAHALVKALVTSRIPSQWRTSSGRSAAEINNVLNSFANSVAGQCYSEREIQSYIHLVEHMGYEKTKLAAETRLGTVYCMPIDAVAYRRIKPVSTEHLTVFVSEGIKTDGTFSVCTITHTSLQSKAYIEVTNREYGGISSKSCIPCDKKYRYNVSIDELFDRVNKRNKYANLPLKEQATLADSYPQGALNKLLIKLNQAGNTSIPLCVMDGGVSYGIQNELNISSTLSKELTQLGMFGLRYDYANSVERAKAVQFLEKLYDKAGTPEKFAEEYRRYADLPLSYAHYRIGLDTTEQSLQKCISDLCVYLKAPKGQADIIISYMTSTQTRDDTQTLLSYARATTVPHAWEFFTLQAEHNGILPDLKSPHEREKLRYLLGGCPQGIDSSLYLKQFAGRDVIKEYANIKPITDPKLLELYGQFPVSEMSQIPLQNVNTFLSYLKENDLSAQDVGQITSQMIKNLTTPGAVSQERGVAEYLKLNTISDAKSLEHLEDISKHVSSSLDSGLDCIMHKGDKLESLMPPINPINIIGNFINL